MTEEEFDALIAHIGGPKRAGSAPTLDFLCAAGVRHARHGLRLRAGQREQLAPRAMRALERHLHLRLRDATRTCFAIYTAASHNTVSSLGLQRRSEGAAEVLRGLFSVFRALGSLWSGLIANWRRWVAEFLRRLRRDQRAIASTFFGSGECGRVLGIRTGLSDPHRGGTTVVALRFQSGRLIYKPRSGHGEQAWFDALSWMNSQGFGPQFKRLQVLQRKDYCWMEMATHRPCRSAAGVRRFYRRVGGMLALAHRLGTVDCHRENFIASGEHPLLVDAEALLHAPASGGDMLPSLLRTGFLPLPNRTAGSEFSASALSKSSGAHRPTLNGQPCDASGYQGELTDGFRLAQSLLTGTIEGRRAFQRRVAALEKLPWRRIVRPTAIYAELCERSLQPAAMRSLNERLRLIRTGCERAGASARIVRAEIDAITQLDIPYFTGRSKAAKPDLTAEALLAAALRQSFTR